MKILGFDIETAPNTAYVWGLWKQNVSLSQLIQTGRVLCFASRWFGTKEPVEFFSEQGGKRAHKSMIKVAWELLDQADAVVHYNGSSFDVPTLNREFVKIGYGPPSPYAQIDLLRTARKQFRFTSNKLAHLLKELELTEKMDNSGFRMWIGAMQGDPDAWAEMEKYNRIDVVSMERLYERLLPWISSHPNHALYGVNTPGRPTCPRCGSENVQSRGLQHTKVASYRRYQCQECMGWSQDRTMYRRDRTNVLKTI